MTGRLLLAKYRERGWLWYHSQMLFFVFHPLPEVLFAVDKKKALAKIGNGVDAPGSFTCVGRTKFSTAHFRAQMSRSHTGTSRGTTVQVAFHL